MPDEVPFSEAERVFNKVQDLVEAHVEYLSPGAGGVSYTFGHMAGLDEYRRIVAHFRDVLGGEERFAVLLPNSTGYTRVGKWDLRLDLTGQEVELLTELVWLGACTGFWYVEDLADVKGQVKQRSFDYFKGWTEPPSVDPLALLAAFASGELEAMWPNRKALIEKGWFIWQARFRAVNASHDAEIAVQAGGHVRPVLTEDGEVLIPEYMQ